MDNWEKYILPHSSSTEGRKQADAHHARLAVENEAYLAKSPELKMAMSSLLECLLVERPADTIKFASNFFSDPHLAEKIASLDKARE